MVDRSKANIIMQPATWSDRAKNATQTAARNAGFASRTNDRMFLITEPEAAAIAALSGLIGEGVENQISAGDGSKSVLLLRSTIELIHAKS